MKKAVSTKNAPQAIGPYSIGIEFDKFVFTSGQLGINPDDGMLVSGGIINETRQALVNLQAVLESGGSSLENVIKTTVFLRDINDFSKMNGIYSEFFHEIPPARSAVQVAALPKGAAVEIEAIAFKKMNE
ncbi:MAG: RidA family protein [Anaerolineaceae bacterium]